MSGISVPHFASSSDRIDYSENYIMKQTRRVLLVSVRPMTGFKQLPELHTALSMQDMPIPFSNHTLSSAVWKELLRTILKIYPTDTTPRLLLSVTRVMSSGIGEGINLIHGMTHLTWHHLPSRLTGHHRLQFMLYIHEITMAHHHNLSMRITRTGRLPVRPLSGMIGVLGNLHAISGHTNPRHHGCRAAPKVVHGCS